MSRSCFASFPVCVYKFSSHYLNNIIFIDNSLGPLARDSPCTRACTFYPPLFDVFSFHVENISHKAICRQFLIALAEVSVSCVGRLPFSVLFRGVKYRPKPRVCHDTLSCVGRKEYSVAILQRNTLNHKYTRDLILLAGICAIEKWARFVKQTCGSQTRNRAVLTSSKPRALIQCPGLELLELFLHRPTPHAFMECTWANFTTNTLVDYLFIYIYLFIYSFIYLFIYLFIG